MTTLFESEETAMKQKNIAYWGNVAEAAVTDEAAFIELYEHFYPRVYQYLLGRTKDSNLADELVSETFIRMLCYLKKYDKQKGAFSTWLFRIACNVLNKYYGEKTYRLCTAIDETYDIMSSDEEEPENIALSHERSMELKNAIAQLPERQQRILELTYWLNMKSKEVGKILGMAPSSVRVALKQARDSLKELLENNSKGN